MLDAEQGRDHDHDRGRSRGLGWERYAAITGLMALTVRAGLGSSGRLTYHEAFVAEPARELAARGFGADWLVPTVGGLPWLEKPPLLTWLVAALSLVTDDASEWTARTPSALAATALVLLVANLANRRFGPTVGFLAGLIQATTAWTILRGRLAEADILLAALIAALMLAFDHLRTPRVDRPTGPPTPAGAPLLRGPHRRIAAAVLRGGRGSTSPGPGWPEDGGGTPPARPEALAIGTRPAGVAPMVARSVAWRRAFWGLLGLSALVKGVGFGAALALPAVAAVLLWDRDGRAIRRIGDLAGLLVAALVALAWPLAVASRHPEALGLWTLHVADRFSSTPEHFIGGARWAYLTAVPLQALPWTPLALLALRGSWRRARAEPGGGDRLLWAWAVVPIAVLSLATVKNAHYAIHALPPWSIWAALGLARIEGALGRRAWWGPARSRRVGAGLFVALGLAVAVGFTAVAPRLDDRGREWTWLESLGTLIRSEEVIVCAYDDWDRKPYPTPFGPIPHDWGIRLFALGRPATWRQGVDDLAAHPPAPPGASFVVIARDRDRPALDRLGRVEILSRGPTIRWDRSFFLGRITPSGAGPSLPPSSGH